MGRRHPNRTGSDDFRPGLENRHGGAILRKSAVVVSGDRFDGCRSWLSI
jgi:hypothetical protein